MVLQWVGQTHLEDLITRHKLHIQKLELILRLLDNDELSPEQVNDVKDFVEDYVERNQVALFCYLYVFFPTLSDSKKM
jgi:CCR4-NOT transcriptional regulation complex NOT5 subunit